MVTRFLPFFLFPEGKTPPKYISYLGGVLPSAAIEFLVVYSLKDAVFSAFHGLPEFLSILIIILLHRWRKKYPAEHWRRNNFLHVSGADMVYLKQAELLTIRAAL